MDSEADKPVSKSRHASRWKSAGLRILSFTLFGGLLFYGYVRLNEDAIRRRATKLLALNQPDDAIQSLFWLSRFDSRDPSTQLLLGQIEIRRQNFSAAIPHFASVPSGAPEYEAALGYLAACQLNDYQLEAAEDVLSRLLRLYPDSLPPYRELSVLLQGELRNREAIDTLLNCLKSSATESPDDLLIVLKDLLTAQFLPPEPDECIEHLLTADATHPEQETVMLALAECLIRTGQYRKADDVLRRSGTQNPSNVEVDLLRLQSLIAQRKTDDAERLIERLEMMATQSESQELSMNADFHLLKCQVQEQAGDYPAACQSMEMAASLRNLDRRSKARYARLLQRTGQSERAGKINSEIHQQAAAELELWHLAGQFKSRAPEDSECRRISDLFKILGEQDQSVAWEKLASCINLIDSGSGGFSSGTQP